MSKRYMLGQLIRFFGWLGALDIASKVKKGEITNDLVGIDPVDLKKEAAGILFRSSQKTWKVKDSSVKIVHGVECLKLRLDHRTAKNIFRTSNIPVISQKDPLTAKIIRNAHLANKDGPGIVHNLAKTTKANLGEESWLPFGRDKEELKTL